MSMLMQYFVCDTATMDQWTRAVADGNTTTQSRLEATMDHAVTLKNLSDTDVRLLACCDPDFKDGPGSGINLMPDMDGEHGRYVVAVKDSIVHTIARLNITDEVIGEWAGRAGTLTSDHQHRAKYLTREAALCLQELCRSALQQSRGFYCCYFG